MSVATRNIGNRKRLAKAGSKLTLSVDQKAPPKMTEAAATTVPKVLMPVVPLALRLAYCDIDA